MHFRPLGANEKASLIDVANLGIAPGYVPPAGAAGT